MGTTIQCFFMEPTDEAEGFLRRFVFSTVAKTCSRKFGYHNASLSIGQMPWGGKDLLGYQVEDLPHDDPRWPTTCPCGYVFQEEDQWQFNIRRLHRRTDTGELMTLGEAPPGAMWHADWYPTTVGPDGHNLVVKTPAGDWLIDAPSSSGGHWTRTGTPPLVTASPSIVIGDANHGFHGWLRDGRLIEC